MDARGREEKGTDRVALAKRCAGKLMTKRNALLLAVHKRDPPTLLGPCYGVRGKVDIIELVARGSGCQEAADSDRCVVEGCEE